MVGNTANPSMKYNTKTRLYCFDPFKPHFYIVKLGFKGYILFFLFLLKNIVGTRQNRLTEAVLTGAHNLFFEQKYEKYPNLLSEYFHFFWR